MATGVPRGGDGQEPDPSTGGWDCSICADILVDPVVGLCGHDFCHDCYSTWTIEFGRNTCPVCRARLPATPPAICLRLKAAVEATAGARVAARRLEIDKEVAERRQRRAEAAAAAPPPGRRSLDSQLAADAELAVRIQRQYDEADAHAEAQQAERCSIQLRQRLAGALPLPLPPQAASYPRDRSAEESRWLCCELGWPRLAGQRAAADPQLFCQEMRLHREALSFPRLGHLPAPDPAGSDYVWEIAPLELIDRLQDFSVQWQQRLARAWPPGLPPVDAGHPGELSAEESRWRCMHAAHAAQVAAARASSAVAAPPTPAAATATAAPGGQSWQQPAGPPASLSAGWQ